LNYTRQWLLAFHDFADKNQGQLPADFEQARPFLPSEVDTNLTTDQFEIVYQGSLKNLTNPSTAIVIREKNAWPGLNQRPGWLRAYGFADGHSEIHLAADGNFETWEKQHTAAPSAR
jgi:hypothetical protein